MGFLTPSLDLSFCYKINIIFGHFVWEDYVETLVKTDEDVNEEYEHAVENMTEIRYLISFLLRFRNEVNTKRESSSYLNIL